LKKLKLQVSTDNGEEESREGNLGAGHKKKKKVQLTSEQPHSTMREGRNDAVDLRKSERG